MIYRPAAIKDYPEYGVSALMTLDLWEKCKGAFMDRPKGLGKFTELLRIIVSVPKEQVEQKIKDEQIKRKKRRLKK